jgi:hypothetical protein
MKRGLILGLALLFAFAFTGCPDPDPDPTPGPNPNPNPNPGTKAFAVTYNLNWPTAATNTAPSAPASVTTNATTGMLTATQAGYSGTTPAIADKTVTFANWYLSKAQADAAPATAGRVLASTVFTKAETLYARWNIVDVGATLDTTGKDVELITLANNYYPVYQFTPPQGKTWGDYETVAFTVAVDDDNFATATASFRVYGNYVTEDFTFLTGDANAEDPSVPGKKIGVALTNNDNINLNKNGPYIMHNGSGATPEALSDTNGTGGAADTWFTLKHAAWGDMSGHSQWNSDNMPAATATGPFYLGVGLPNLTYYVKDVKLVGKTGTADLPAVPAYFSVQVPGVDTAPAVYKQFCPGYGTTTGADGFKEISRAFVNASGNSAPISLTLQDDSVTVTLNYNYPSDVTTTPTSRTETTDLNGRLTGTQLAALSNPTGYKFEGWFGTQVAVGGTVPTDSVSATTVFTSANNTVYAFWTVQTKTPALTPLVLEGTQISQQSQGSNLVASYTVTGGVKTATVIRSNGGDPGGFLADADEFALMGASLGTWQTGATNALLAVKWPYADVEGGNTLYNTVKITYETVTPDFIIGSAAVDPGLPPASHADGMKVGFKVAFGSWTDITNPANAGYKTLAEGENTETFSLSSFSTTESTFGFSIQNNGASNGWLLRINKIEFSYVAPGA